MRNPEIAQELYASLLVALGASCVMVITALVGIALIMHFGRVARSPGRRTEMIRSDRPSRLATREEWDEIERWVNGLEEDSESRYDDRHDE
jgi:hypothetical protein